MIIAGQPDPSSLACSEHDRRPATVQVHVGDERLVHRPRDVDHVTHRGWPADVAGTVGAPRDGAELAVQPGDPVPYVPGGLALDWIVADHLEDLALLAQLRQQVGRLTDGGRDSRQPTRDGPPPLDR